MHRCPREGESVGSGCPLVSWGSGEQRGGAGEDGKEATDLHPQGEARESRETQGEDYGTPRFSTHCFPHLPSPSPPPSPPPPPPPPTFPSLFLLLPCYLLFSNFTLLIIALLGKPLPDPTPCSTAEGNRNPSPSPENRWGEAEE
eukprot:768359-Hanusia_phi.AAC.5